MQLREWKDRAEGGPMQAGPKDGQGKGAATHAVSFSLIPIVLPPTEGTKWVGRPEAVCDAQRFSPKLEEEARDP